MTSSAGPGISLMSEFTGLGYYAEIPAVIFDVQRCGPSTGLPTRTGQQDILSTAMLSHGDTKHPLLLPGSVTECYTMAMDAFDLAEQMQTPVFVMSDLDLGMNTWMSQPFDYPTKPLDRGKLLDADALKRVGEFARYRDVDGDGIPYRTVPGDGMPAYFTRGSGHNEKAQYSERAEDYSKNLDRLARKFETARTLVPKPEVEMLPAGKVGIIGYGTTHWAIVESRDQLSNEAQLTTSYLRLQGLSVHARGLRVHRRTATASTSSSRTATARCCRCSGWNAIRRSSPSCAACPHYAGLPIDGRSVTTELLRQERAIGRRSGSA